MSTDLPVPLAVTDQPTGCAVTAHLLPFHQLGRWLILRTARDHSRWQLPGGRIRPGESPRQAAEREAHEETGLDLPAREFLIASWIPGNRRDRLALLFATRTLTDADLDAITLQTSEVDAWSLTAPAAADLPVHPLLAERLTALATLGPGHYLEQLRCP
ncbi:NUDIX domain-containing protein [Nonomuraea sediminis]|uniref:NUDIX domain-containing protein n=1 Tax=Nonomuraea sediminis TaxID=2835864 RepID=UPI001BDCD9AC|nr:NUDIX hydrolase [Nonomuraea sediminis]